MKDLRPAAIEYALEWNKITTESEINLRKRIVDEASEFANRYVPDSTFSKRKKTK